LYRIVLYCNIRRKSLIEGDVVLLFQVGDLDLGLHLWPPEAVEGVPEPHANMYSNHPSHTGFKRERLNPPAWVIENYPVYKKPKAQAGAAGAGAAAAGAVTEDIGDVGGEDDWGGDWQDMAPGFNLGRVRGGGLRAAPKV
jgi:hypothetical protein